MKASELRKKKDAELTKLLMEKRDDLREFKFGSATSSNSSLAAALRKDISRILTELKSRSLVS